MYITSLVVTQIAHEQKLRVANYGRLYIESEGMFCADEAVYHICRGICDY